MRCTVYRGIQDTIADKVRKSSHVVVSVGIVLLTMIMRIARSRCTSPAKSCTGVRFRPPPVTAKFLRPLSRGEATT